MTELTKDEIFNLVNVKFKKAMQDIQAEINERAEIYTAIAACSIETLSFAIATMIKNDYVDMDTSMFMTTNDIRNSIKSFLDAFEHFENLN